MRRRLHTALPFLVGTEYCPRARALEKQASRDQDAEDLRTGKKSVEDLRAENGKFAFPDARIDWEGSGRFW